MAPDRTVGKRGEERSLTARGKGGPVKLIRLTYTQHPRPPQRELRQRGVFDLGGNLIAHVENIYVDEERTFQFVGVAMPGSITLTVDRQTVESAPKLGDPRVAPDESYSVPPASTVRVKKGLCC